MRRFSTEDLDPYQSATIPMATTTTAAVPAGVPVSTGSPDQLGGSAKTTSLLMELLQNNQRYADKFDQPMRLGVNKKVSRN
jgi:hypothetical protein